MWQRTGWKLKIYKNNYLIITINYNYYKYFLICLHFENYHLIILFFLNHTNSIQRQHPERKSFTM
jgi:hypothetical protein